MNRQQTTLIDALDRVEDFIARNTGVMNAVITSVAHQNFSASRARMVEFMKEQNEHTRALRHGVTTLRKLRAQLVRKHLRPVSVVARAELPESTDLAALTIPWRTQQLGAIVAAAHGMARAAKTHEAAFLAAGLPEAFIEKLVAATEALKEAMNTRGRAAALAARATGGLRKEGRVARKTLRILDTLVRSAVEDDDVLVDQWQSISRVAVSATSTQAFGEEAGPGEDDPADSPSASGDQQAPEAPAAA